jgi:hypothetical protein
MRVRDNATRREGGGATTRDESGWWTTQGKRVESYEGATRWRRTATEVRGEEVACPEVSIRSESDSASFEQVFWCAEKNTGVILRPQTPLSYTSKKKGQNDVTAETEVKSTLKN